MWGLCRRAGARNISSLSRLPSLNARGEGHGRCVTVPPSPLSHTQHRTVVNLSECLPQCGASGRYDFDSEPPSYGRLDPSLPAGFFPVVLTAQRSVSADSKVLTFALPRDGPSSLEKAGLPTSIKIRQLIKGKLLDKSYSPISAPVTTGHFDLLVKKYPEREGGGLGLYLCSMQPGDQTEARIKPQRLFWGEPYTPGRWEHVLMVAGGTGVAPLFQMAREMLHEASDGDTGGTRITLVTANHTVNDILLADEIDTLVASHHDRLFHFPVVSQPSTQHGWLGGYGRVTAGLIREALQASAARWGLGTELDFKRRAALVCGTDGFLDTVCGDKVRLPASASQSERKVQGPVRGILRELGYETTEVTRM